MKGLLHLLVLTFVPGVELRGAIPISILYYKNSPLTSFLILTFFNILIVPLVFLLWDIALFIADKIKIVDLYLQKLRKRSERAVEKYGFWALALFVAVPLPGTGAYTGAFIAELFGMNKKKAFLSVSIGVFIAGLLVTLMSIGVFSLRK